MTIIVAPSVTGDLGPGIVWLPDQWLAMMRGDVADLTQETAEYREPSDTANSSRPGPSRRG
jgi:hypothetical protein